MNAHGIIPVSEDIDRQVYEQILSFIRLRVTETYAYPPEIVQVDGITIATLGNFSASVGKPKSKKTFNCAAIVASALSGRNILHYKAHLPEGKHKVLYVDTEQSKCHCHKVLERILKLAGMPTDQETDRLVFFMLREYSPKQRRQIINHALAADPEIGFVVIDGIRDLMYDINSPSESVDLINDLMRWSSMHDLHIHTVLHLNKGDDNTRGHIGTELNNKAETILQVTKSQFDGNISEVKAMHIREREFQPGHAHPGTGVPAFRIPHQQGGVAGTGGGLRLYTGTKAHHRGHHGCSARKGVGNRIRKWSHRRIRAPHQVVAARLCGNRFQTRSEHLYRTEQIPDGKRGYH